MKVVCCADIHLDGSFRDFSRNDNKLALRRQETRETFCRIIEKVQENNAFLLLIAGDLFDANRVTEDTISFLMQAFASIPNTYVLISPGNNDPATSISPYNTITWPENVYIFTRDLEAVELSLPESSEKVRIYGAGFQGRVTRIPLLNEHHVPDLDPAYINILLMHASMKADSSCNPITPELLDRCGFDFCVLGHAHNFSGIVKLDNTFYAYPGACEERSFPSHTDAGTSCGGGILSGTISHKYQELTFTQISTRHHVCAPLDITHMSSQGQIEQAIRNTFSNTENLYRITLKGIPHPALQLSVKPLEKALSSDYFYLRLRTKFSADMTAAAPLRTGLLQDYFLNEAQRYSASQQADPELLRLAVQYGLAALSGQDIAANVLDREEFWSNED